MLANIEEQAAAAGIMKMSGAATQGGDRHRVVWTVRCSRCPVKYEARWDPSTSPDLMIKNLRRLQWDVGHGLRPLCPDCAHPKKEHGPLPKPDIKWEAPHAYAAANAPNNVVKLVTKDPAALQADAQAVTVPKYVTSYMVGKKRYWYLKRGRGQKNIRLPDPTAPDFMAAYERAVAENPPAEVKRIAVPDEGVKLSTNEIVPKAVPQPSMKITRQVFMALDDTFDPGKRRYCPGYDDARVARECGTSEEVVIYLRREAFGEIAADPRVDTIRRDIADLATVLENLTKTLRDLESRIDQVAMVGKGR